jgi:MFS transporter, SP family, xylose:H+ symportor
LLSEMFPTRIRGVAMGIAIAFNWFANYLVSQSFPIMNHNPWLAGQFNQAFPFLLYGVFSVLAVFFVVRFVPETKGHSLESLESVLRGWRRTEPQAA